MERITNTTRLWIAHLSLVKHDGADRVLSLGKAIRRLEMRALGDARRVLDLVVVARQVGSHVWEIVNIAGCGLEYVYLVATPRNVEEDVEVCEVDGRAVLEHKDLEVGIDRLHLFSMASSEARRPTSHLDTCAVGDTSELERLGRETVHGHSHGATVVGPGAVTLGREGISEDEDTVGVVGQRAGYGALGRAYVKDSLAGEVANADIAGHSLVVDDTGAVEELASCSTHTPMGSGSSGPCFHGCHGPHHCGASTFRGQKCLV